MHAIACAANASLSSTRSSSSTPTSARASALRVAGIGPNPIRSGATPAAAHATKRAMGRKPHAACRVCLAEQDRRCAVVDTRRVAGGHRSVRLERRLELSQYLDRRLGAWMLVAREHGLLSARARDRNGNDFVGERSTLDRRFAFHLRFGRKTILFFARNSVEFARPSRRSRPTR